MNDAQHGRMKLQVGIEPRTLKSPFRITGYTFTGFDALVVTLHEGGWIGRGEAQGVYYKHDNPPDMLAQVEALRGTIEHGITRSELLDCLPPGGARHAIDAALWDLEAKRNSVPVWKLAGIDPPQPLMTTFTIGADEPATMASHAHAFADDRPVEDVAMDVVQRRTRLP